MQSEILVHIQDRVAYLTLNRPDSRNSFVPSFITRFIEEFTTVERDPDVRVIAITGAGPAFSSGGDKAYLRELTTKSAAEIRETVYGVFAAATRRLIESPKPTVAIVNGPAVGAGCELAIACDFRVMAREAFLCESWVDMGAIAALGGTYLLPRLIGLGRAADMIMRGVRVYGDEARTIGLASEAVDASELTAVARQFAEQLAAKPPLALSVAKRALRRGLESSLAAESDHSVVTQGMLMNTADFREGVAALEDGRRPRF